MPSEGEVLINTFLTKLLGPKNIKFEKEKRAVFKLRWDFYIPTKVPIVIEFDGIQHKKFSKFFHKNKENFSKYQAADELKNKLSQSGKVNLIRIENKDIDYFDFLDLLKPYMFLINELEKEIIENDRIKKEKKRNKRCDSEKKKELFTRKREKSSSYFGG